MKKTDKKTRINKWFLGVMNNESVKFKFTYSWDLNKQVVISTCNGNMCTSLQEFNVLVKPIKMKNIYVEAK